MPLVAVVDDVDVVAFLTAATRHLAASACTRASGSVANDVVRLGKVVGASR